MKRERRYLPAAELRVQRTETGEQVIEGYAVVYNSLSEDMGFREMVAPGSFSNDLAASPDVRCLFNHDDNLILGRTKSGTLQLTDDAHGLSFRCVLPETTYARDLATSIERGDISQCSFGFLCEQADWSEEPSYMLRTITQARLFDVSPVCFPAYQATSVTMRSLFPDGNIDLPEKKEARDDPEEDTDDQDGCQCDCDACESGDCAACDDPDCNDAECRCGEQRTNTLLACVLQRRVCF